jgi:hypothetical protein
MQEKPDFVAIHNGYSYDVRVMAVHAPIRYARYFTSVNLGLKDKGYDLVIPGVTMIDTYRYLDTLHSGTYDSLSLDHLGQVLAGRLKTPQPSLRIGPNNAPDMSDIIYYNVSDSELHVIVAIESKSISELMSMCPVFKCPIFVPVACACLVAPIKPLEA